MVFATVPDPALDRTAVDGSGLASFEAIYDENFDFVWRSLRRLGVQTSQLDDAVQDVFVVVHRRLSEFEGRSSIRTWLFAIAMRVAQSHRRRIHQRSAEELCDDMADSSPGPHERTARAEAVEILYQLLDELDDDKRALFILVELEQMKVMDAAKALGINHNTLYSRLRSARDAFEAALCRHRNRDHWRQRWTP